MKKVYRKPSSVSVAISSDEMLVTSIQRNNSGGSYAGALDKKPEGGWSVSNDGNWGE